MEQYPEVMEVHAVFGNVDLLLRIVISGLNACNKLLSDSLASLLMVQELETDGLFLEKSCGNIPFRVYTSEHILSTFKFDLHALAAEELTALSRSPEPGERRAAAQLLTLLELARTHPAIRERLLTTCQTITVSNGAGSTQQVDIKLIKSLVEIANDARFQTDAVRRIRDLTNKPADKYRVFFAQRPSRNGVFVFQILGVFHRDKAYSVDTLSELKRRYESRA